MILKLSGSIFMLPPRDPPMKVKASTIWDATDKATIGAWTDFKPIRSATIAVPSSDLKENLRCYIPFLSRSIFDIFMVVISPVSEFSMRNSDHRSIDNSSRCSIGQQPPIVECALSNQSAYDMLWSLCFVDSCKLGIRIDVSSMPSTSSISAPIAV